MSDDGSGQASPAGTIAAEGDERFVTLGRVSGAHGIQGWIKVHSETSPRDNIVRYSPWYLSRGGRRERWQVDGGRLQGKAVIAKLGGCDDRDRAEALAGAEISVPRSALPATREEGEYYWADLVGLTVTTVDGVELGRIDRLFETGSNDVIVVHGDRERLVPYIWRQVVRDVDLENGVMIVDWDADF
ncbi:MAG: ribosome maturation factor RimM [Gammaproteobacteria bacterium]|nr:ribosome maturation factor RimM [Gammaproteobacteria bacterium]